MLFKMLTTFVVLVTTSISALYLDSINSSPLKADVGIVYGNKIELNGQPSHRLAARLDAAITLYSSKIISSIFVSGGIGTEGFNEASVMKSYLVKRGVKDQDITIDNAGNNTHLTSVNAANKYTATTIVVAISQHYHISRAKLSLRNAGFTHVYGYAPSYCELRDTYSYLRELPAWVKYKLLRL